MHFLASRAYKFTTPAADPDPLENTVSRRDGGQDPRDWGRISGPLIEWGITRSGSWDHVSEPRYCLANITTSLPCASKLPHSLCCTLIAPTFTFCSIAAHVNRHKWFVSGSQCVAVRPVILDPTVSSQEPKSIVDCNTSTRRDRPRGGVMYFRIHDAKSSGHSKTGALLSSDATELKRWSSSLCVWPAWWSKKEQ